MRVRQGNAWWLVCLAVRCCVCVLARAALSLPHTFASEHALVALHVWILHRRFRVEYNGKGIYCGRWVHFSFPSLLLSSLALHWDVWSLGGTHSTRRLPLCCVVLCECRMQKGV